MSLSCPGLLTRGAMRRPGTPAGLTGPHLQNLSSIPSVFFFLSGVGIPPDRPGSEDLACGENAMRSLEVVAELLNRRAGTAETRPTTLSGLLPRSCH